MKYFICNVYLVWTVCCGCCVGGSGAAGGERLLALVSRGGAGCTSELQRRSRGCSPGPGLSSRQQSSQPVFGPGHLHGDVAHLGQGARAGANLGRSQISAFMEIVAKKCNIYCCVGWWWCNAVTVVGLFCREGPI